MVYFNKQNKPNVRTGSRTAPKKAPRSYESSPGVASISGTGPSMRVSRKVTRPYALGAKNQNLKAKM